VTPFDLTAQLMPVLAIMRAACGLDDSGGRQWAQIVLRHATRAGLVARGAFASGRLLGFCYGFPVDNDGRWEQQIRARMTAAGALDWLDGNAFELTELHVHPDHHGQGLGRRLLMTVLAATDLPRALLNARAEDSAARRLYRSLGFTDLTPPFHFGPGQPAYTVMGATLRAADRSPDQS